MVRLRSIVSLACVVASTSASSTGFISSSMVEPKNPQQQQQQQQPQFPYPITKTPAVTGPPTPPLPLTTQPSPPVPTTSSPPVPSGSPIPASPAPSTSSTSDTMTTHVINQLYGNRPTTGSHRFDFTRFFSGIGNVVNKVTGVIGRIRGRHHDDDSSSDDCGPCTTYGYYRTLSQN